MNDSAQYPDQDNQSGIRSQTGVALLPNEPFGQGGGGKNQKPDGNPTAAAQANDGFKEAMVKLEKSGDDPDGDYPSVFQKIQDVLSKFREEQGLFGRRKIKVVLVIGPGTAGKTFLTFRLANKMPNYALLNFERDTLPVKLGYVGRTNVICGFHLRNEDPRSDDPDYLFLDCPGERYSSFVNSFVAGQVTQDTLAANNFAACLYWCDAVALVYPAFQLLATSDYLTHGDSSADVTAVRNTNIERIDQQLNDFGTFRSFLNEIKAIRNRLGRDNAGAQTAISDLVKARQPRSNQPKAERMATTPVKLFLSRTDELLAFRSDLVDFDRDVLATLRKRQHEDKLVTKFAAQFINMSWDFVTAFDVPDKLVVRNRGAQLAADLAAAKQALAIKLNNIDKELAAQLATDLTDAEKNEVRSVAESQKQEATAQCNDEQECLQRVFNAQSQQIDMNLSAYGVEGAMADWLGEHRPAVQETGLLAHAVDRFRKACAVAASRLAWPGIVSSRDLLVITGAGKGGQET